MLDLLERVRAQCAELDGTFVDAHFRRLPPHYFERYAVADIVRHLRLLAGIQAEEPVALEARHLAARAYEVLVVGNDHSGTVACITAAVAAYGLNLEDLQVASYFSTEDEPGAIEEPNYFIVQMRVSGDLGGRHPSAFAQELHDRLRLSFLALAEGNFSQAQAVAAETFHGDRGDVGRRTPRIPAAASNADHSGLIVGGDFRLDAKVAVGGMSEVYLATQINLNRTVAVKLIRPPDSPSDDLAARFYQEALVLGQFNCPSIVQVFAAGTVLAKDDVQLHWMAMEHMGGGDLDAWLKQRGVPNHDLATRWLREALEGLHYAHRRSVLHRDLKPHNLLLTAEGHLKVSDFGLLKHVETVATGLTPRAAIIGTPHYMSPEQATGDPLDERSDIFSLGTTFFHLLTGRLPFQKHSPTATLFQIAHEDAPPLLEVAPDLPAPLALIVNRMMARKRELRYQDIGVILEDLASFERRGLLKVSSEGAFRPVTVLPAENLVDLRTQAYVPPSR